VVCSCTLSAMTLRKLSEARISVKSQTTIKCTIKLSASVTETIIFMYLGIAAVSSARHWNTAFVVLTLLFCLLYRTIGTICTIKLTFLRVFWVQLQSVDLFRVLISTDIFNETLLATTE